MLGLPKKTELKKQLPKNAIYSKFHMNTVAKEKFDADISKMYIVNEISIATTAIAKGEYIESFFVLLVQLKQQEFNDNNIALISKLISQNMLFILQFEDKAKLAIYHTKLLQTDWQPKDSFSIELKGLNFDVVWENIIIQVGSVHVEGGNTLYEQIEVDDRRQRLEKEITRLDKLARKEKQPKKKFELVQEINLLKKELEEL